MKRLESDQNLQKRDANQESCGAGAAKASVAVSPPLTADADLQLIIDEWRDLPSLVRASLVALVRVATRH